MPRSPSDTVQITVRVPSSWLALADEAAKAISRPGFEATRTDAFRAAIARGLEELTAGGATPHSTELKARESNPGKKPKTKR